MASRRAYADEYAVRVNRAAGLLVGLSPADAVRGLQAEFGLSERQARRYVNEALVAARGCGGAGAHGGVHGEVGAVVDRWFARAGAVQWSVVERGDGCGGGRVSRSGGRAARWQGALRSSSLVTASLTRGWRRRMCSWRPSAVV